MRDEESDLPYENLHLGYIKLLCSEGFKPEAVTRALAISKNDLSVARNILHEFVNRN